MWRGLIGLLFVVAAIGCFVGARYAPEATNMYILIDLGCAALAEGPSQPRYPVPPLSSIRTSRCSLSLSE